MGNIIPSDIKISDRVEVKASNSETISNLPPLVLSDIDNALGSVYVDYVFISEAGLDRPKLLSSLRSTLSRFPPLSGVLCKNKYSEHSVCFNEASLRKAAESFQSETRKEKGAELNANIEKSDTDADWKPVPYEIGAIPVEFGTCDFTIAQMRNPKGHFVWEQMPVGLAPIPDAPTFWSARPTDGVYPFPPLQIRATTFAWGQRR